MIVHVAFILIYIFLSDVAQAKDVLKCRECKDTQDPKSCSDVIVCGQEEECETREFVNHLGHRGFRMGCGSKNTCGILKFAQTAFGRRRSLVDAAGPAPLCNECCGTQECNADLCQTAIPHTPPPLVGKPDVITCMECKDTQDPKTCLDVIVCGQDEACATWEFINHLGQKGFRMGCESKSTCNLQKFIGTTKRRSSHQPSIPNDGSKMCHECCYSEECNADLCASAVIHDKPSCPDQFLRGYNDTCYLIGPGDVSWTTARQYCQNKEADLLVFNSKDEHGFWVKKLKQINATYESAYWIGGYYSHAAGEWEWTDMSADHYTPWPKLYTGWIKQHPENPDSSSSSDHYVYLHNPVYSSMYKNGELYYTTSSSKYSFICKKHT